MNEVEEGGELRLYPLTPNDSRKKIKNYKKYLDEAIKNKKIRNIALSGNYGSGKSSILLTYFKGSEYEDKKMQISLASFNSKEDDDEDTNLLNIEKNIINQILYQIPVSKIPLTNFKIKREITFIQKIFLILELILITTLIFRKSEIVLYIFSIFEKYVPYIGFISSIYTLLSLFVIWNVWMLLKYVPIKKLNIKFQNVEAEINKQDDELFEKYADEIVYLLEKSGKEILVIEDLDRFKQLKIFEKLRELNIKVNDKLNSSNKNKFTFIYAIKDDLFDKNKDRTKFFDLIIPVIPYLNAKNSYEKLKSLFSKKYNISDNLVYLLSFYIDDMRLLLNIYNEFVVYKNERQNSAFNEDDKLLSLIVCKNLFNKDYEELKFRKGELYDILSSVEKYREKIRNEIQEKRIELAKEEEQREFSVAKTKEDVFTLWLKNHMYQNYSFRDIMGFIGNPQRTFYYSLSENSINPISSTYENIQKDADYQRELELAITNETIQEKALKKHLFTLEKKLSGKLKDIVSEKNVPKEKSLVYRLIVQGYIDESYENYINYSYAEKNDEAFLSNLISNGKASDFDSELNDLNKITNILTDVYYKKEAILNNSFLNYLIEKADVQHINEVLNTSQKLSIGFVEQYYNKYSNVFEHLLRLKIKIDITKLNEVEDRLVDNYLFIDNEKNYEFLVYNNWKNKLVDEELISETINDTNLSENFIEYYIPKLRKTINLKNIDSNYYDSLLKNNKVIPSSANINLYYEFSSNMINRTLVEFINQNDIYITDQLTKDFFDNLININEISNEKYKLLFENFNFEDYSRDLLNENLEKEKLEILVNLHKLILSYDMVKFLEMKNVAYINNNEKEIIRLLSENENLSISSWKTMFDSVNIDNIEKKKLFLARINELNFEEFKDLLVKLSFNDRLIKVVNKQPGYHKIRLKIAGENQVIKEYLATQSIIDEGTLNKIFYQ